MFIIIIILKFPFDFEEVTQEIHRVIFGLAWENYAFSQQALALTCHSEKSTNLINNINNG